MHKHPPSVCPVPMLPQIHALPGAQPEPPVGHGDRKAGRGDRRADMAGHVIGPLVRVIPSGAVGHEPVQPTLQVRSGRRVGVLLDQQARGGVPDEHGAQPSAHTRGLHDVTDAIGDLMQPTSRCLDDNLFGHARTIPQPRRCNRDTPARTRGTPPRARGTTMTTLALLAALAAGRATGAPIEETLTDASAQLLPLAVTNGKTMDMEAADLDGDGFADLVLAVEFGQNAVLFWRDDRYVYDPDALPQRFTRDSEDIAIADLDSDGDLDLVFASEDDMTNELYLNDGKGRFTDATDRLPVTGTSNAVVAFDADADGDADLIFGNNGVNLLCRNDGSANFTYDPDALPQLNGTTQDIEVGDIDGDGDPDLIIANEKNNRVLVNNGEGVFTDNTEAAIGMRVAEETREADLGDIDGDGDLDLVFANVGWSNFPPGDKILVNDGTGVFADESVSRIPFVNEFSLDADFADIDGDGDLDLITARIAGGLSRPASVLINDGEGNFTEASESFIPSDIQGIGIDVELLDLNHDGTLDLYIGCHLPSDFVLLG